ncbi:hypothetical protein BHM03_00046032 [Ensete ventricosum]|nr:hypothetical protein BHM03_00046032 [Ensete ventricosum]
MRLNHVELFYALVAAIGSESRRCLWGRGGHMHVVFMQRLLATARPPAGAADHGLAACKGRLVAAKAPQQGGGRLRPGPLQRAAGCGQAPCKGRPPAGAEARKGRPPASTAGCGQPARGGGTGRRGGRPLAGRLSTAKGSRRLCRGNGGGGAVRVNEG